MSDPVLAEKDPAIIVGEALATYKEETGTTLAPADPRRLHMQALLLLISQDRSLIDFAGKQSLLRFVSDEWIDELALLWGETRIEAEPSECQGVFNFTSPENTIEAGRRVTDGTNIWEVVETATGSNVTVTIRCTVAGAETNGVAVGQIDEVVEPDTLPPFFVNFTNTTPTSGGSDEETVAQFRVRLVDFPESESTCGPRLAYQNQAKKVSDLVADAVALGTDDGPEMTSPAPGAAEVRLLILEGERDDAGELISVIPTPSAGLMTLVGQVLSGEELRPLADSLEVLAPNFIDFDANVTYYIAESRSDTATQIQEDVEEAFEVYLLWQQSKIGRDVNPSELITRLVNAGAKRVAVTDPAFDALAKDESARLDYQFLAYGGIEAD